MAMDLRKKVPTPEEDVDDLALPEARLRLLNKTRDVVRTLCIGLVTLSSPSAYGA